MGALLLKNELDGGRVLASLYFFSSSAFGRRLPSLKEKFLDGKLFQTMQGRLG